MAYNVGANLISPLNFAGASNLSRQLAKLITPVALVLFCVGVAIPGSVYAQDIIGPETRRVETTIGPYKVVAEANPLPSLQAINIIIRVMETNTGLPSDDVKVTVYASLSGSDETGWAHAISPNAPGLYSATVELETPGVWETTLEIESPDGTPYPAQGFVFEVTPASTNPEAGYVFIAVALILIAGAGYLVWRIRKNQRQRADSAGGAAT